MYKVSLQVIQAWRLKECLLSHDKLAIGLNQWVWRGNIDYLEVSVKSLGHNRAP